MSATISRMRSGALAPYSVAPEPVTKYVQQHTVGWWNCAFSSRTSAPGQPNPTLPSSVLLHERFQSTRHTFLGYGFEKARERTRARITATVLELEREMPKIRAFALQQLESRGGSAEGRNHARLSVVR